MTKGNTLVYLFRMLWRYSAGNRINVMWYWLMFIVANALFMTLGPLIWAKIMNIVQQDGVTPQSIKVLLALLGATLLLDIVFWALHGPARQIEKTTLIDH